MNGYFTLYLLEFKSVLCLKFIFNFKKSLLMNF